MLPVATITYFHGAPSKEPTWSDRFSSLRWSMRDLSSPTAARASARISSRSCASSASPSGGSFSGWAATRSMACSGSLPGEARSARPSQYAAPLFRTPASRRRSTIRFASGAPRVPAPAIPSSRSTVRSIETVVCRSMNACTPSAALRASSRAFSICDGSTKIWAMGGAASIPRQRLPQGEALVGNAQGAIREGDLVRRGGRGRDGRHVVRRDRGHGTGGRARHRAHHLAGRQGGVGLEVRVHQIQALDDVAVQRHQPSLETSDQRNEGVEVLRVGDLVVHGRRASALRVLVRAQVGARGVVHRNERVRPSLHQDGGYPVEAAVAQHFLDSCLERVRLREQIAGEGRARGILPGEEAAQAGRAVDVEVGRRREAAPSTFKSVPERPAFLAVGDSDNRSAFAAAVAPVASLSLMISMPLELPAPDANAPIGPGTPFPVAKMTASALPVPDPAVAGVGAELVVLSTNAKLYPQRLSFTLERE